MTAAGVIDRARAAGVMLAAAESCTGGLLIGALTEVPGASDVVDRGFVTYSNSAKREMLGVRQETLERHGAVSREVAQEMASGALRHSDAGIAVAITGVAGPGGSESKPEGRVCFAVATSRGVESETVDFGALGRSVVRARSLDHALELLARALAPEP
jgi:nicotinamide-nucleotide amidase